MQKLLSEKKGFTLVEVMLTVVITGILAGVVIPRVTVQQEAARLGEARQMLGAIRKAQLGYADYSDTGAFLPLDSAAPAGSAEYTNFQRLGLQAPGNSQTDYFRYVCAGSTCSALRLTMTPGSGALGGGGSGGSTPTGGLTEQDLRVMFGW